MMGAGVEDFTLPTMGAERSLICVTFLSFAPFVISPSRAPCQVSVWLEEPGSTLGTLRRQEQSRQTYPSFGSSSRWSCRKASRRRWWRRGWA